MRLLVWLLAAAILCSFCRAVTVLLVNASRPLDLVPALALRSLAPNIAVLAVNTRVAGAAWTAEYTALQLANIHDLRKVIIVGGPLAVSPGFVRMLELLFGGPVLYERLWGYSAVGTAASLAFLARNFVQCVVLVETHHGDVKNRSLLLAALKLALQHRCAVLYSEKTISPCVQVLLSLIKPRRIYCLGNFNFTQLKHYNLVRVNFTSANASLPLLGTAVTYFPPEINFSAYYYNYRPFFSFLGLKYSLKKYSSLKKAEMGTERLKLPTITVIHYKLVKLVIPANSTCYILASNVTAVLERIIMQQAVCTRVLNSSLAELCLPPGQYTALLPVQARIFCSKKRKSSLEVLRVVIYHSACPHCLELLAYLHRLTPVLPKRIVLCPLSNSTCLHNFSRYCRKLPVCGLPTTVVYYKLNGTVKKLVLVGFARASSCLPSTTTPFGKTCTAAGIPVLTDRLLKKLLSLVSSAS
ncbi:MAG: hypothetical protein GXO42_01325 [bacterium]|nr:hypothetical protein [bacterium]